MLNIHTSPLLETDFTMGLGRGRVCMRHIFYCLTAEEGTRSSHLLQLTVTAGPSFSFKTKILTMNDLDATVILIRWAKHSNQMEAGPVRFGEGWRETGASAWH